MRAIFPNEKPYINKLLDAKKQADFSGLQSITFIREYLGLTAIARGKDKRGEYIISYIPRLKIIPYYPGGLSHFTTGKYFDSQTYLQLVDILSLFKELEKYDYVFFSRMNNNGEPFYDRSIYKKFNELTDNRATITEINKEGNRETIDLIGHKFYGGIAKLFDEYSTAIMFPTNSLDDLVSNDFVDIEQRNFEKQMKSARHQIWLAWSAFIIAFAGTGFTVWNSITSMYPVVLDYKQVKQVEQAIIDSKVAVPEKIEVFTKDTMKVKEINPTNYTKTINRQSETVLRMEELMKQEKVKKNQQNNAE